MSQRAAIESDHARILILAGAGTGKTWTLTRRLARLVESGVAPESIRLVTFTNRAAREMVERAVHLLGPVARRVRAGTFHALAYADLSRHGATLGLPARVSILPRDEATALLARVAPDLPAPRRVLDALSLAVDTGRPLSQVLRETAADLARLGAAVDDAVERFANAKAERGRLDFDDLLIAHRLLLDREPSIAAGTTHVLVDEYQDTSAMQAAIAERLAEGGHLCVVGDDAQSIFAFRGARHDNILRFGEAADTAVFRLTECYRCQPAILDVANRVLARNVHQHAKTLTSQRPVGPAPDILSAEDPEAEAQQILERVRRFVDDGVPLARQAVLFRSRRDADAIRNVAAARNIPMSLRVGARSAEAKQAQRLRSVLQLLVDPTDADAWRTVLAPMSGVGARTIEQVLAARDAGTPSRILRRVPRAAPVALKFDALEALEPSAVAARAVTLFDIDATPPTSGDLAAQIAHLALDAGEPTDGDGLTLSTVHQAKGLEWDVVYVIGLADGMFPHEASAFDPAQLEEERRLLHVAATRAKDVLVLSRPASARTPAGRIPLPPSRFLDELGP